MFVVCATNRSTGEGEVNFTYVDSGCGRHWNKSGRASQPLVTQEEERRKRQIAGRAIDVN